MKCDLIFERKSKSCMLLCYLTGKNRLIGDMMALSGSFLSGISVVSLEHSTIYYNAYEFLGFVGLFGSIITALQM